jgi:hypothetical protein
MGDADMTTVRTGELLWRLQKEGAVASCELHLENGGRWMFVVRIDDEVTGTRHYDSERITRHYADALRQDYLRDGWSE